MAILPLRQNIKLERRFKNSKKTPPHHQQHKQKRSLDETKLSDAYMIPSLHTFPIFLSSAQRAPKVTVYI